MSQISSQTCSIWLRSLRVCDIIPLCPMLHPTTSVHDNPSQPYTWIFEEDVLEESVSQLWSLVEDNYPNQVHEALVDLLSLSIDELPYRSDGGMISILTWFPALTSSLDQECFTIGNIVPAQRVGILQWDTKIPCIICSKEYILGNMRMHVGRHILYELCGQFDQQKQEVGQILHTCASHLPNLHFQCS